MNRDDLEEIRESLDNLRKQLNEIKEDVKKLKKYSRVPKLLPDPRLDLIETKHRQIRLSPK